MSKLQSLYGLKFHPFRPDVPIEALYTTPAVDSFLRRLELGIADGGFVMISGDPGTGKSAILRMMHKRLSALPDVMVGAIEHPQSRTMDFYRTSSPRRPPGARRRLAPALASARSALGSPAPQLPSAGGEPAVTHSWGSSGRPPSRSSSAA